MVEPLPDLNALPLERLFEALNPPEHRRALFELARREDLADAGDVTTEALLLGTANCRAAVVARQAGIFCGGRAIPALCAAYGRPIRADAIAADGARLEPGETAVRLEGTEADLLILERPLLNTLCRLSGIATLTRRFVDAAAAASARIFDTRKTTPGWRGLEKYAVRCGGGFCHRLGLYDAILVKDNHLAQINPAELTRTLTEHLGRARFERSLRFIEVEVDSLDQLRRVLACPAGTIDIILLDNMQPEQMREAVQMRDETSPGVQLEASGGVTLDSVAAIAQTGVERIAVGALTHSAAHLDFGMDAVS